jgi:serine/threonine protein kinase
MMEESEEEVPATIPAFSRYRLFCLHAHSFMQRAEKAAAARKALLEKAKARRLQEQAATVSAVQPPLESAAQPTVNGSNGHGSFKAESSDTAVAPASVHAIDMFSDAPLPAATLFSDALVTKDLFVDDDDRIEKKGGIIQTLLGKGSKQSIDEDGPDRLRSNDLHADNWDDAEGYMTCRVGEVLNGRYEVTTAVGKGVFSTVLRCRDSDNGMQVAVKVIRRDPADHMYNTGKKEIAFLQELGDKDPESRKHVIRMLTSFEYKNHLCMVFESMHMNLRELLSRYGKIVGISIVAVKQYAKQMFVALKHLQACRIIHADLKLDNIVVNESKNSIRICDLGSAERWTSEPDMVTPYRQSRFYRAPEVTLGLNPGYEMDMWSAACCLFELYTGKILFYGSSNNQMIKLYMEVKGPFPKKLIRRAQFAVDHFADDCETFLYRTKDVVTGMDIIQKMKVLVRLHIMIECDLLCLS